MADQIDINQLVEELQKLVPELRKLSTTSGTAASTTSKDTDRLIRAIAQLSVAMNKREGFEKLDVARFTKSVDQAIDAQEKKRQADEAELKKIKEAADAEAELRRRAGLTALERAQEDAKKISETKRKSLESEENYAKRLAGEQIAANRSQGLFTKQIDKMAERQADAGKDVVGFYKKISRTTEILSGLGTAGLAMGKALYEGKQGASANNDALDQLGKTAESVGASFGPLGMIVGKIVKWFFGYVAEANKLSDRVYKSYQDLSKVGVAASDGMMGLAESAVRLGLGLDETGIQNFVKLMTEASEDLALMSGSAIKGRQSFTDFSSAIVRGDTGRQLMNMGMSVEAINEGIAGYIRQQNSLGRAQGKTQTELQAGAVAYLKEMDALTKLTGMQKKALEEQMEANRRNERFRAAIEKVRREQGDAAADSLEMNMAVMSKRFPELAEGLKEIASGYVSSEKGVMAVNAGLQHIPDLMTKGIGSGTKELADALKNTTTAMGGLAEVGAYGPAFGNFYESLKAAGMTEQEARKEALRIIEDRKKQEEGLGDAATAAQTNLRRSQMDTRDSLQNLVAKGVEPATGAMSSFASIVSKVTNMLGGPTPKMGATGGGAAAGGAAAPVAPRAAGGGAAGAPAPAAGGAAAPVAPRAAGGGAAGAPAPAAGGAGVILGGTAGVIVPSQGAGIRPGAAPGAASLGQIRDLIAGVESRGDYNVVVGGTKYQLTDMTVQEVLALQKQLIASGKDSAAGKYQIKYSTLAGIMGKAGVGLTDKFDQSAQDKLADALIMQRGFNQYASNPTQEGKERFLANLAREWAGLPGGPSGESYYKGVGNNKAGIGWQQALASFQTGGIASGPRSGYTALLHGNEAVVPLPDGKTIPVEMPNLDRSMEQQVGMMGAQLVALEELVRYMRENASISAKILQAAHN